MARFTEDDDRFIREHYGQDMSATKIGRYLGKNKNSVIGRAGRLGLNDPERSPIRKAGNKSTRDLSRPKPSPKPRPAQSAPPIQRATYGKPRRVPVRRMVGGARFGRTRACQWIEGQPSIDDACKCGARAEPGYPYCEPHLRRAYVVRPPRPAT